MKLIHRYCVALVYFLLVLMGKKAEATGPSVPEGQGDASAPELKPGGADMPLILYHAKSQVLTGDEMLLAGHRSHSSHASHRSGSGGYQAPPVTATPQPASSYVSPAPQERQIQNQVQRVSPSADELYSAGMEQFKQGQYVQAKDNFRKASSQKPTNYRYWRALGVTSIRLNDYEQAVHSLKCAQMFADTADEDTKQRIAKELEDAKAKLISSSNVSAP